MKKLSLSILILLMSQSLIVAQNYGGSKVNRSKIIYACADISFSVPLNEAGLDTYSERVGILDVESDLMNNLKSKYTHGDRTHFTSSDSDLFSKLQPWERRGFINDFNLGILSGTKPKNRCFMASLEGHLKKWFGFKTQIESVQTKYGNQYPVSVSIELSSTPGLMVNIDGLIGAAAAFSSRREN